MEVSELVVAISVQAEKALKGLDDTKKSFQSVGDSAKSTGKSIRKNLDSALTSIVKQALPIATVTGAMVALGNAHKEFVNVSKQARATGIPVEDLQAWARAATKMGYSSEDAKKALVDIQTGMQEAALTGRGQMAGMLQYMNVRLLDSNGKMRKSSDLLKDLSSRMSKMSQAKAFYLGKMMGLSPEVISMLREGKTLVKELDDAYNYVATEEQVRKQEELDRMLKSLSVSAGDLATNLLLELTPSLIKVLDAIKPLAEFLASHPFFTVLGASAFLMKDRLMSLIPVFKAVASAGASAFAFLVRAITAHPLIAAITAIIGVFSDLYDFMNGAPSLTGDFLDWIGVTNENIEKFKNSLKDAYNSVKDFFGFGDEISAERASRASVSNSSVSNVSTRNTRAEVHNEFIINTSASPTEIRRAIASGIGDSMNSFDGEIENSSSGVAW